MRSIFLFALVSLTVVAARRRSGRDLSSPRRLEVQTNGNTITLKWEFRQESSLRYFTAKYRKRGEQSWRTMDPTRGNQVILSNLDYNTRYELQVEAVLSNGQTYASTIMEVPIGKSPTEVQASRQTTAAFDVEYNLASGSLPVVRNLRAAISGRGSVHLVWERVETRPGPTEYEVTVTENRNSAVHLFVYGSTTANIDMLSPGSTYQFQVRTKSGDQLSYPAAVQITLPSANEPVVIASVIRLESNSLDINNFKLVWSIPEQYLSTIASTTVYYGDSDNNPGLWAKKHVGGSDLHTNIELEPGKEYYVRIETNFRESHRASTTSPTYKFQI